MNLSTTLHRRFLVGLTLLSVCLFQAAAVAAPLTKLWTYDSGVLADGRVVLNVGQTPTVGTDGSLAFVVTVATAGEVTQHALLWFDKEQANPLAPTPIYASAWAETQPQPAAVRLNHLMYLEADGLYSFEKGDSTPTLIDTFQSDSATSWMIEQSRAPGVLYIFEAEVGATSFKVHAYQIDPVNTDELLVSTEVDFDGGLVTLAFPTQADAMYQPESSDDLVTWAPQGAQIVGNGTVMSVTYTATEASKKFYRIRKL